MQTYPHNLKSLALLAVLVLCLFAFTLVSTGEAQAQERLSQAAQRPMAEGEEERSEILDGKGADQVTLQTSPVETASVGSTISEASPPGQSLSSPVGSAPPASKPEPTPQQYVVI